MTIEGALLRIEDSANFKFSKQNDASRFSIDPCFCSGTAEMGWKAEWQTLG